MIGKIKRKYSFFYHNNELFIKIISIVVISIFLVSTVIFLFILKISERSYIDSYQKSNDIILTQIQSDYETLNDNIVNMLTNISQSQEVLNYVTADSKDPKIINRFFYEFTDKMNHTNILDKKIPSNLILVGENGNIYYHNGARRIITTDELLSLDFIKKAKLNPQTLYYEFLPLGLTSITNKQPVLAIVKVLFNEETGVLGYAIISITERDFSDFYSKLVDKDINTISIINKYGKIISSNTIKEEKQLYEISSIKDLEKKMKHDNTIDYLEVKNLYSLDLLLTSQIDTRLLAKKMVVLPTVLTVTIGVSIIASVIAFFIIQRTTKPIYLLTKSLPKITQGDFDQKIPVQGSSETKELARVYNGMLSDLNEYINQLVQLENQKRMAEINALQMQIQPHFIYNTLTSIKFLIWQNEQEKAVLAMDAFIRLLQHTIGESDEFVTLDEELMSIRDYILILQMRFGENINVYIHEGNSNLKTLVPKMILQPIIENTFIHAFPNKPVGNVDLFIKQTNEALTFEIIDNGVGMAEKNLYNIKQKTSNNNYNHFSGVGIKNIDRRLKLIYGKNFGIKIASSKDVGTTVKLTILPTFQNE